MRAKFTPDVVSPISLPSLIAHAPLAMAQTEGDGHIVRYVNAEFCRLIGTTAEKILGRGFTEVVPGGDRCQPLLDRAYGSHEAGNYLEESHEGSSFAYWSYTVWPSNDLESPSNGLVIQVTEMDLSVRNVKEMNEALLIAGLRQHELTESAEGLNTQLRNEIAERKDAQQQVIALNAILEQRVLLRTARLNQAVQALESEIVERQRLEAQVLEISEGERKRLGMDLHDELAQMLLGTSLLALALKRTLAGQSNVLEPNAAHLVDLLNQSVEMVRNLAKVSYPVELEIHGLHAALKVLLAQMESASDTRCKVRYEDTFHFQDSAAIHLYRIAQEAVSNAIRHGRAKNVAVRCTSRLGHSIFTIRDDGIGFDPRSDHSGLGLHFFQYRAHLLGARVRVRSRPGKGATVICILTAHPVPPGSEESRPL